MSAIIRFFKLSLLLGLMSLAHTFEGSPLSAYSAWSDWSQCNKTNCRAGRFKVCLDDSYCPKWSIIRQEASCFMDEDKECSGLLKERIDSTILKDSRLIPNRNTCGKVFIKNLRSRRRRIVNGQTTWPGAWPWQVALLDTTKEQICGATILNSKFVLTAAHCLRHRMYIRAGEYDLDRKERQEQEILVAQAFVSSGYKQDPCLISSDIAILRLSKALQFNAYVWPVCLPEKSHKLRRSTMVTIIGWGLNQTDSDQSKICSETDHNKEENDQNDQPINNDDKHEPLQIRVLNQAEVPIVSIAECKKDYNYIDYDFIQENSHLCAGKKIDPSKLEADACQGDSGGPLLFKNATSDQWFIHGVVSFGSGCAYKYGVFTKVINFIDWIKYTINVRFGKVE